MGRRAGRVYTGRMKTSLSLAALLCAALGLAACQKKDEPPPVDKPKVEGRAETRTIRNTQAIGYDGKAIADKVDAALDKNEKAAADLQKAADAAGNSGGSDGAGNDGN